MKVPNKPQSMVFYSSIFEGALVHKNWSSVPLVAFLATKINKEQQPHHKYLYMSSSKVWLSICSSLLANSLFLSALKTSVSLLSKKSISHGNLNIEDNLPATGFSIVSKHQILITFFFCYIWKHKKILIITI